MKNSSVGNLDRGIRPLRVFKSQQFLIDKKCSLKAQNIFSHLRYNQILQVANSGSTWGWCLLEGIKNSDLISLGG